MNRLFVRCFATPLGTATAMVDEDGRAVSLTLGRRARDPLELAEEVRRAGATVADAGARADALVSEVGEYFAGQRQRFELRLRPRGTAFQRDVWQALARIPFGTTTTYGALAREIGRPSAVRAVGAANGANPLWLVLPCHRVVGSDGKLTGYAGGLDVKRALLEHEGLAFAGERVVPAVVPNEPSLFA